MICVICDMVFVPQMWKQVYIYIYIYLYIKPSNMKNSNFCSIVLCNLAKVSWHLDWRNFTVEWRNINLLCYDSVDTIFLATAVRISDPASVIMILKLLAFENGCGIFIKQWLHKVNLSWLMNLSFGIPIWYIAYISQVTTLEQTPREKCILNTCLAVIITVAVGLYAFFSINPLSAEETENLRMEALNRSLYHGNSTS